MVSLEKMLQSVADVLKCHIYFGSVGAIVFETYLDVFNLHKIGTVVLASEMVHKLRLGVGVDNEAISLGEMPAAVVILVDLHLPKMIDINLIH